VIERALLVEASGLFNRKLYFECHDLLEDAWAGERGEDRAFLQALIHVSVGLYHVAAGNHLGAASLLERGLEALAPFLPERSGLDVLSLSSKARVCLEKTRRALAGEAVEWEAEDVPLMKLAIE
jgi:predicted metal-dependent hydrolase